MEWLKKWLTDGFTKVPLLSISINLKFFKKYGTKYSCTCRVNKLFKNDWYIKRTMEDLCEYIRKNYNMEDFCQFCRMIGYGYWLIYYSFYQMD